MRLLLAAIFPLFLGASASAKVFNMGKESFAAYLKGQYSAAAQGDEPFSRAGPANTTFDSSYKSNMTYEFGFIYASELLNWRFGFEFFKPADLKDIKADNASGATLYTVGNTISGYAPKIGLELNLKRWKTSRLYAGVDYGQATITVQNSYTLTTAGATAYPSMTDNREEVEGTAPLIESALGFETLLSDSTTIAIDAGYRQLQVDEFTHKKDAKTFQGSVLKGAAATNTDGSARTLNLGGAFGSIWLRFWIN